MPDAKLAVIGDVHGNLSSLQEVLAVARERRCDGLLLVGDFHPGPYAPPALARKGRERNLAETFAAVEAAGLPYLWVPGNHDRPDIDRPGNADRSVQILCGLRVAGIGGAGPARFGFPYEWDEDEIRALDRPAADILLYHAPPIDTLLDRTRGGFHAGSLAIRELALAHRGALVCGHIHEAAGIERLGQCLCMNAGSLGEPYARLQCGFLLWRGGRVEIVHEDFESGRVQQDSLLLDPAPDEQSPIARA